MEVNDWGLTQARVRELLTYDATSGELRWRVTRTTRVPAGTVAGSDHGDGYCRVCIDQRRHYAHRLAWLWFYGEFPGPGVEIDHINGDRRDNRILNLRLASFEENHRNSGRRKTNTSGYKGVVFHKPSGLWYAAIRVSGVRTHLGYYKCPKLASAAYVEAAKRLHGEFANSG